MAIGIQRAFNESAVGAEAAEILSATMTGAHTGMACWERRPDGHLYLVAANVRYLEFIGRPNQDLLGERLQEAAPALGPQGVAVMQHVVASGEHLTLSRYPIRHSSKPGVTSRDRTTYWDVTMTPVPGVGPPRLVVSVLDVTDVVAAEEALTSRNAELQRRQAASRARLEALAWMASVVGRGGDLDAILLAIAEGIFQGFALETVVNLLDEATDTYVVSAVVGESSEELRGTRNDRTAIERVLLPRHEIVPDVYFIPHDAALTLDQISATVAIPNHGWHGPGFWHPMDACLVRMRTSQGKTVGLLSVDSSTDQRIPGRDEFELLRLFAVVAANAAENVLLAREIGSLEAEREMQVLRGELEEELMLRRSLLEIGGRLGAASAAASTEIFPLIAERLGEVVPLQSFTVSRVNHTTQTIRPIYHSVESVADAYLSFEVPFGTGATGAAVLAGQSVISNADQEGGPAIDVPGTGEDSEHLMAVPVMVDERITAVLTLHRPVPEPPFTAADARRAELFAQHVGLAFLLMELADTSGELAASRRALSLQVERLEDLNRFKDEFVANVSHELRTPLTAVLGNVSTALHLNDLPEGERRGLLEAAERQAKRLAAMMENLLDESRLSGEEPPLVPLRIDAGQFVEEVAETLRSRAPGRVVETDAAGDLMLVSDTTLLYRILFNFGDNALKYSDGPVRYVARPDGEGVCISVSDEGRGIDTADIPRVFERFEQLGWNGPRSGVGLGLHLSIRAAEALGGRINLDSQPGHGSTFSLWLPRELQTANRTWTTSPSRTA
jgi:signal transduction histidine kinase